MVNHILTTASAVILSGETREAGWYSVLFSGGVKVDLIAW